MEIWNDITKKLVSQYQLNTAYNVTVAGYELEEIEGAGTDLHDAMTKFENKGHFPEDAIDLALKEQVTITAAPKGFVFVRLTAEGLKPITIMIPSDQL